MQIDKNCCVRLPKEVHKEAKLQAYKEGCSLQEWVLNLILEKLVSKAIYYKKICEKCGKWKIEDTKLAQLGNCDKCKKENILTLPCLEE